MFFQGHVNHVLSDVNNDCTAPSGHHGAQQCIVNSAIMRFDSQRCPEPLLTTPNISSIRGLHKNLMKTLTLPDSAETATPGYNVKMPTQFICPWLTCERKRGIACSH